ncbi:hypothetical protein GALL_26910 [mine drainage metagenome]|uniref:Uncharacterized protein n=1 Tax=mine drainage metagenome TaxID=410659 RepID=A0A1J5TXV1_9ZZZZ
MKSKKRKFLEGHKRVGKKLIPPMLQIPNVVFTAFRNDILPDLIWMSPLFLRSDDRTAVNSIMEFLNACREILNDESAPALVYLSNFNKLTAHQKEMLANGLASKPILNFLIEKLGHQNILLHDYPIKFLFGDVKKEYDKKECIKYLEADVDTLLDRYSSIATKIQVTAIVSMMATGKMFVSSEVALPDFNTIFTDPASDEAKHAASFARANLNGRFGFDSEEIPANTWPMCFWRQSFGLSGCR